MNFNQLITTRRSHRVFTSTEIHPDVVQQILRAALMSPTSRNQRAWHFVVVDDKSDLEKLADAKEQGSSMLAQAALAVVVLGDATQNDCWVEDGSIAAITMQYQAHALGVASCWVQIRGRRLSDATPSSDVVRGILHIPDTYEVLCILAFGHPAHSLPPHDDDTLLWERVHLGQFTIHN